MPICFVAFNDFWRRHMHVQLPGVGGAVTAWRAGVQV